MNTGKLRNHERIPGFNSSNSLGVQEREMLMQLFGPQDRLDYPTEILKMANGCEVEKYIILDEDRQKVLDALYPFNDPPALDAVMLDLHTQRMFKVRDYIVTREDNGNFLVTPFYAEAGGTVLDWVAPDRKANDSPIISVGIVRG